MIIILINKTEYTLFRQLSMLFIFFSFQLIPLLIYFYLMIKFGTSKLIWETRRKYIILKQFFTLKYHKKKLGNRFTNNKEDDSKDTRQVKIYNEKNTLCAYFILAIFMAIIGIFFMINIGKVGIFLGTIFMFLPGFIMSIVLFLKLKNPHIILREEYLYQYDKKENTVIYYSDIYNISLNNDTLEISVKNNEKYLKKDIKFDSYDKNKILYPLGSIDFNLKELIELLNMKIKDSDFSINDFIENKDFEPNTVSLKDRVISILLSILIFSYVLYSLIIGEMIVPGNRGNNMYLYGTSLYIMALSAISFIASWSLTIIDHYDLRDNEYLYKRYKSIFFCLGYVLFSISLIYTIFSK